MATTTQNARPIVAGFAWALRVQVNATTPLFPTGVALTSQVKRRSIDATALATLTTVNGTLVRIDDATVEIRIAGATSAAWKPGTVTLDMVRTDLGTPQHLAFRLTVPVVQSVTRV